MTETYKFQAEINQLMNIIVNAFYSQKDIFLRELVSNSSDALDKARYESLTNKEMFDTEPNLNVKIMTNKANNTLSITDTGIGMSREELVENLGTVARSGTRAFMEKLKDSKDMGMIGQFGVGFYSAFLVADKVEVTSRGFGQTDTYKWTSLSDQGEFTVEQVDNSDLTRGTEITLTLKEDCNEFLDDTKLKDILQKHSMYITYPIELYVTKTKEVEVDDTEAQVEEVEDTNMDNDNTEAKVEDVDEDEEKTDDTKKKTVTYNEYETVNNCKPLWTYDPSDVTTEQYTEFYKTLMPGETEYAAVKHFKVEGNLEFTALLYVPKKAPSDMFQSKRKEVDVKLHVRKVFITNKCTDMVPEYLSFLKGVVDSNDLPLNVSREMVQHNKVISIMAKQITKRVLDTLASLAEDDESKYLEFYKEYSKNIKLGVHEDEKNKDKLIGLLRFYTSNHKENPISLEKYVEEMKEDQKNIYYISGESFDSLENTPFLESLKQKEYDVLLLVDPVDEYAIQKVNTFNEKELKCVTKEGFKLEETTENTQDEYKKLTEYFSSVLGTKVEKVIVSNNLVSSPCVLTTAQWGWSANMQRIMKSQALNNDPMTQFMMGRKVMEVNPSNKLVTMINNNVINNTVSAETANMVHVLYDTAVITSGFTLDKPQEYASRVHSMLESGLSGSTTYVPDDLPELEPVVEQDEESNDTDEVDAESNATEDTQVRVSEHHTVDSPEGNFQETEGFNVSSV